MDDETLVRTRAGPTGELLFLPVSALTLVGLSSLLSEDVQGQWAHMGRILSPALSGTGKEESDPEVDFV